MKKNCRIKLFAWMLTAVMLVCASFGGALAENGTVNSDPTGSPTLIMGPAKINEICSVVTPAYYSGDTAVNIQKVNAGESLRLVVTVKDYSESSRLPDQGTFVYDLPQEVRISEGATTGSNSQVTWTANGDKQINVSWTNGKVQNFTIEIPVTVGGVYPLYNMAVVKINGADTWYRMGKTTISTAKPYTAYTSNVVMKANEFTAEDYNFKGTTLDVNGRIYVYADDQDPENPQPYFTASFDKVEISQSKIGGMDKNNNPRWMVSGESMKYDEPNTNGGYHRNYKITLHDAPEAQVLYNLLQVGNDGNYYRLRTSGVTAKAASTYRSNQELKPNEYILNPNTDYDFTNTVLNIKGVTYTYSPTEKTGDYEAYYTVEFVRVVAKDRIHTNASWFTNPDGWLDGSEKDYVNVTDNNTWGIHRDYRATLHPATAVFHNIEMHDGDAVTTDRKAAGKAAELPVPEKAGATFLGWNTAEDGTGTSYTAENPLILDGDIVLYAQWQGDTDADYSIVIAASWPEGQPAYPGTPITLTATLSSGFEGKSYTLQWQHSTDLQNWTDQPGANDITYTYILSDETAQYYWRIVARDIQ